MTQQIIEKWYEKSIFLVNIIVWGDTSLELSFSPHTCQILLQLEFQKKITERSPEASASTHTSMKFRTQRSGKLPIRN